MVGAAHPIKRRRNRKKDPVEADYEALKELALSMARMLVDDPNQVVLKEGRGDGFAAFEVTCANDDGGALLGRRGKHAEAMKTVLIAAAAVRGINVYVNYVTPPQHQS